MERLKIVNTVGNRALFKVRNARVRYNIVAVNTADKMYSCMCIIAIKSPDLLYCKMYFMIVDENHTATSLKHA